ncbi:nicotinamide N-methyltransferase-like isoform X3 [Bufo bufo]|uniref:nicotinamide N-methyltransferase-like isoform X3 n=1 Tax=Bufo bufo TaxID=8384 RepID=UPI001ABE3AA9|nr:nicotinamide N-methyltransferase-like isoform X3 [Bufo bufo]
MTAPHTSAQAYIDNFNARDYLQTSYAPGKGILFGEWIEFATRNLHETFTTGGVRGDTLLDFGTGASIYHLLSACEVFDKIIVSDLLEQNRAEFKKWLNKDPDAFDWTPIIKRVCELEGNREDSEKKAEKLRILEPPSDCDQCELPFIKHSSLWLLEVLQSSDTYLRKMRTTSLLFAQY